MTPHKRKTEEKDKDQFSKSNSLNALRILSISFGILVGFFTFEHGLLEVFQGNTRPTTAPMGFELDALGFGYVIDAIGPNQRLWEGASEPAFTIIPNFLITGIIAMIIGVLIVLWSIFRLEKKYGVHGFAILSILSFLFGGGFATIFTALIVIISALFINRKFMWWKNHISDKIINVLATTWLYLLIFTLLYSLFAVSTAVFGYPLLGIISASTVSSLLIWIGNINTILMIICIFTSIGYNSRYTTTNPKQDN